MDDEYELEYSPHCGVYEENGRSVDIQIYRAKNTDDRGWILELVDCRTHSSIVWEDPFETDGVAYEQLMKEVSDKGLARLIDGTPET